jgi:tetratricopeptide (TPR) repeat protein
MGFRDGRRSSPLKVLEEYRRKVASRPKDPALRVGLGNVLRFLGREEEAMEEYRTALELDPLAVEACSSLSEIHEARNEMDLALHYCQDALAVMDRGHYYRTDPSGFREDLREKLQRLGGGMEPHSIASRSPSRDLTFRATPRVGRNAPCPCGSGKKYKKCCLNKGS